MREDGRRGEVWVSDFEICSHLMVGSSFICSSGGKRSVAATQIEDFNDRFPAIICTIPM
jgi:hypothetical protein